MDGIRDGLSIRGKNICLKTLGIVLLLGALGIVQVQAQDKDKIKVKVGEKLGSRDFTHIV